MKYEITDQTMTYKGRILHRIKSLKDFSNIKKDDVGGWIENERNLSQKGHCWIEDDAKVYGYASVYDDARVMDNAEMCDTSKAADMALICEQAKLSGNVFAYGQACVTGEFSGNLHLISGVRQ